MADDKRTAVAIGDDLDEEAAAEGYDPNQLIFSAHSFIRIFQGVASVLGSAVAMSGVTTMIAAVGPTVLPLEAMQQVLRDTADILPAYYAKYEERQRTGLENRKDLN